MNYSKIKAIAKLNGLKVSDLIALSASNDPFYAGTPSDVKWGEWFAELWEARGAREGVRTHLRSIHYQTVSREEPVIMPNGKPYGNTTECWSALVRGGQAARYLGLVNIADFSDKRSQEARIYLPPRLANRRPSVSIVVEEGFNDRPVLSFPDYPQFHLEDFAVEQPVHVEVWCEKSTMDYVLEPLCSLYGCVLQTSVGQQSITRAHDFAMRVKEYGKPAVILYIADFDPSGLSMAPALSRKVEYLLLELGIDTHVQVLPVALNYQQVLHYNLPVIPVKKTDSGRGQFLEKYKGAVELDALEALHKGELWGIVEQHIVRYHDTTLAERVHKVRKDFDQSVIESWYDITDSFEDETSALYEEFKELREMFNKELDAHMAKRNDLWSRMSKAMLEAAPDVPELPKPVTSLATGVDPLFDSSRGYFEQIGYYKRHKNK